MTHPGETTPGGRPPSRPTRPTRQSERAARDGRLPIVGAVLAGGRSERFGSDKVRATIDGATLVQRAVATLRRSAPLVVLADRGRSLVDGTTSLPDLPGLEGGGPAAGLLAVADAFPGSTVLALACDLPLLPAPLLDVLLRHVVEGDADLAMFVSPRGPEPAAAAWGATALEVLRSRALAGRRALRGVLDEAGIRCTLVPIEEAIRDPEERRRVLWNVNRPDDLERVRGFLSAAPGDGSRLRHDAVRR